ncbi:tRNA (adenosine(37)-N6)-threonylcarbamoyltransferase complex transferase subunit TsaD [Candidatus Uhrbacteria bacterium CG_4_10_14_0_8_um_filter_58_22]|uniref:tRNA N6-adenosine threonylcarbamoyltransferase n=1 Tax=Candidatus Uhrbacteria bacterium CG_4_10_14_0_8_um_filter_58_22 TaxID=1975029 RepID=A0A2M7QAJ4_9BACT|nr:MAG: tRNA (adenosine(37)-N6)-threonylcarbamoyltransferase complex transferase subunit TsaD [Parcubacteria group bacterium CG1_02_58_44]PIY63015.1 MAG: tRNA (adenosine(37)-N6)-threonylcarbamoyltransferase complex transferase subunit TsaD [Candidatus Uhrbacteria bacterium CG_4_10_14_0_8_um_filter_58_22]
MRIIGIESSCDDSAVAYLEMRDGKVVRLEQVVASQLVHANYGGVVPEVAAREHSAKLPVILKELAHLVVGTADGAKLGRVTDLVAATAGPGLATSLRVGLDTARGLAAAWNKPFFAINHIDGHVSANWLPGKDAPSPLEGNDPFPAVALVVSGGHTELLRLSGHGDYELLGATLDDAAGEAFDKTAKLMGLGYPGGPAISRAAVNGNPQAYDFPRPMSGTDDFNFSFSGLKTSVRYFIEKNVERLSDPQFVADLSASVEQAIVDVLVLKTVWAAEACGSRTVLLAGGVAANRKLRETLRSVLADRLPDVRFVEPRPEHCTDNAAMIAMAGHLQSARRGPDDWRISEADPNWELGR